MWREPTSSGSTAAVVAYPKCSPAWHVPCSVPSQYASGSGARQGQHPIEPSHLPACGRLGSGDPLPSDGGNHMQGKEQPRSLVTEAKEQVVGAVQGAGDVTAATVDAVSHTIVHALQGTRAAGTE